MERELDLEGSTPEPVVEQAKPDTSGLAHAVAKAKPRRTGPNPVKRFFGRLLDYKKHMLIALGAVALILVIPSLIPEETEETPPALIPVEINYTLSNFFDLNQSVLSRGTIGKIFFSNETHFIVASPKMGTALVYPVSWDRGGYAFAGDINNDGVDDLMILAEGRLFGFTPLRPSGRLKELLDFGDVYFSRTAMTADVDGDEYNEIVLGVRTSVSGSYELTVVDVDDNASVISTGVMMDCSMDGACFDAGDADADREDEIFFLSGTGQINGYDYSTDFTLPLPLYSSSNIVILENRSSPWTRLAFADKNNNSSLTILDFQTEDYVTIPAVANIAELASGDINGDGFDEVIYRNASGKINFFDHTTDLVIVIADGHLPRAADFNNDNRLDILFTDSSGYVLIYYDDTNTVVNVSIAPLLSPGFVPLTTIK